MGDTIRVCLGCGLGWGAAGDERAGGVLGFGYRAHTLRLCGGLEAWQEARRQSDQGSKKVARASPFRLPLVDL